MYIVQCVYYTVHICSIYVCNLCILYIARVAQNPEVSKFSSPQTEFENEMWNTILNRFPVYIRLVQIADGFFGTNYPRKIGPNIKFNAKKSTKMSSTCVDFEKKMSKNSNLFYKIKTKISIIQ